MSALGKVVKTMLPSPRGYRLTSAGRHLMRTRPRPPGPISQPVPSHRKNGSQRGIYRPSSTWTLDAAGVRTTGGGVDPDQLDVLARDLDTGAIVVLGEATLRIHRLPIGDDA